MASIRMVDLKIACVVLQLDWADGDQVWENPDQDRITHS